MNTQSSNPSPKTKPGNSEAQTLMEASEELLDNVQERVVETKDALMARAESVTTAVTNLIRERPIVSVLSAFGLGYLLMRFVRRS